MGMRSFARLRGFALCAALATTAAGWTGAAPPGELPPAKAQQLLARLPLRFEPNQGQHSAGVRFSARNPQMSLDLSARRARLRFPGQAPASLDISWPGSNSSPRIVGADPAASKSSYFLGNRKERWRTGVPHYKGVRYQGLYLESTCSSTAPGATSSTTSTCARARIPAGYASGFAAPISFP